MWYSKVLVVAVIACALACSGAFAQGVATVKKDGTGDYTTIQNALNDLMGSTIEIVVYPGVYQENISITGNVTLRAFEGPYLTTIKANNPSLDTVSVANDLTDVKLIGFYITNGRYGVYVNTGTNVFIANCAIGYNHSDGLRLFWTTSGTITNAQVLNNVFVGNTGAGIFLECILPSNHNYAYFFYCTAKNNIFVGNQYAMDTTNANNLGNGERVYIDYGCLFQNSYGATIGVGKYLVPHGHDKTVNPMFVGQDTALGKDVRLQATSSCIDGGDPNPVFNDPDGTKNDMGAYGGPQCSTFFESPTDGPIVRNVTITPGSVPQGGTFTINATVAVR